MQSIVKQIEEKTMERRGNILKFVCNSGIHHGRIFETESRMFPEEIFGDAVKLHVFWEPVEFSVVEYIESKYIWTNYVKEKKPDQFFHFNPTIFPNNFKIKATPIKVFLEVDKSRISGITDKWGDTAGFGFFPFGLSLNLGMQHVFLYEVDMAEWMDRKISAEDLPHYINFDFDMWNLANLTEEDFKVFKTELFLFYNIVSNDRIKKIYKKYDLYNPSYYKINSYDFDVSNYCKLNFTRIDFEPEVGATWTKKDIKKSVQKIVKVLT